MRELLDDILSPRLISLDKNSPINIQWFLHICNSFSTKDVSEKELISYLQGKGYFLFFNQTPEAVEKETKHIEQKRTVVVGNTRDDPKNKKRPFNPNEFLNEIENNVDLTIYTHRDNDYLIQKYRDTNESKYLDRIIEVNIKLVQSIAKKFLNLGHMLEYDDLVQIGIIGLYKAVEKFDENLGYSFSTYATWWIKQRIHREIMVLGFTVRLPVHIHGQLVKLKKLQKQSIKSQRKIDEMWIANHMGIDVEKYNELLKIDYYFYSLASLNTYVSPDGEETELLELINPNPDLGFNIQLQHFEEPDQACMKIVTAELLDELLDLLTDKESDILRKRMGLYKDKQMTLEEIGVKYDLTRERIRQIEAKALRRLKMIIDLKKWDKYDLML
ncbi:sigma-70 family RNA polymerase sigma factor [Bacillus albus]|uniref:sigma-70 family RNA polymerase sigma factor n=1 Tax=Bacillus albus TaxID=2026189 RepID=UPI0013E9892B|nr:sigma-70 family RNA polymerase sigma factor [Bacillus albus]